MNVERLSQGDTACILSTNGVQYSEQVFISGKQEREMGRPRLEKGEGASPKIQVRLGESLKADLQRLADQDRRKLATYIRLVLEDHAKVRLEKSRGKCRDA